MYFTNQQLPPIKRVRPVIQASAGLPKRQKTQARTEILVAPTTHSKVASLEDFKALSKDTASQISFFCAHCDAIEEVRVCQVPASVPRDRSEAGRAQRHPLSYHLMTNATEVWSREFWPIIYVRRPDQLPVSQEDVKYAEGYLRSAAEIAAAGAAQGYRHHWHRPIFPTAAETNTTPAPGDEAHVAECGACVIVNPMTRAVVASGYDQCWRTSAQPASPTHPTAEHGRESESNPLELSAGPLASAVMRCIGAVAADECATRPAMDLVPLTGGSGEPADGAGGGSEHAGGSSGHISESSDVQHLCNGLDVYLTHEPDAMYAVTA